MQLAVDLQAVPYTGRTADRARLEAVLPRLRGGLSAALVITGDAGMGKSRLLEELVQQADDLQTITIAGYEAEAGLDFAALRRLLTTVLGRIGQLPVPQRDALTTAFGLTSGRAPDRFLVGLAVMTLLEDAARERPLLCVVDDVQWVDPDTLEALTFVSRRLDAEGIGLVFGLRAGGELPPGLAGVPHHRLRGMPDGDMRLLLSKAVDTPPAPDVALRLVAESSGNPLAMLEYLRSLSSEQLAGSHSLPPALPVGELLTAVLGQQISRLPGRTRQVLVVLSAVCPDESGEVLEACSRLGFSAEAIEPAWEASVLQPGPRLAFRHPLLRSVVHDSATPEMLRRVHAALAEVADERGQHDSAAWHLSYAIDGPDEDLANRLDAAADRARGRGGHAAQATLLTMAMQRSIEGSEDQARRLLAAAHTHVVAGNGNEAVRLLEGWTLHQSAGAPLVARRVAALLEARNYRGGQEASELLAAARGLPPEDIGLIRKLLQDALLAALETRDRTMDVTLPEVAAELLRHPLSPEREATANDSTYDALAVRVVEGYRPAAPLLRATLHGLQCSSVTAEASAPFLTWLAMEDLWDDEFASTTWSTMTSDDVANGAWERAWIGLAGSATTAARHGQFEAAQQLFDDATSLCLSIGGTTQQMWALLCEFTAWRGLEAQTRAMADSMIEDWPEQRWFGSMANFARMALTVLELSLGHYAAALDQARQLALADPPGHGSRVLPELVEAACRTGHTRAAREALDELTVRATAAGTPWARGVLARSRGLVLGSSDAAEPEFEAALELLSATPLTTEVARTQLVYGEWLRRRKRRKDAREQLALAQRSFADMGAMTFAQRAADELIATGLTSSAAPMAHPSALTPQERRVAERAAQGMTNAEISELMYLSASTVDFHLSKVFRKLEITSRRRIKDKLAS